MASFDELLAAVNERADKLKELNHSVLFDLGDDGKILINSADGNVTVTPNPDNDEAEATLALSSANMAKLIEGDLNPMVAFTMGRLKVFGSKGIALKLASLLEK